MSFLDNIFKFFGFEDDIHRSQILIYLQDQEALNANDIRIDNCADAP